MGLTTSALQNKKNCKTNGGGPSRAEADQRVLAFFFLRCQRGTNAGRTEVPPFLPELRTAPDARTMPPSSHRAKCPGGSRWNSYRKECKRPCPPGKRRSPKPTSKGGGFCTIDKKYGPRNNIKRRPRSRSRPRTVRSRSRSRRVQKFVENRSARRITEFLREMSGPFYRTEPRQSHPASGRV